MQLLKNFLNDECGASMVEYAMLMALIALASLAAINQLGTGVIATFDAVGTGLTVEIAETAG